MAYFMTANCPPPHVHLAPAQPVAVGEALSLLETYLASTNDQPHLHPDCRFNETGPTLEGRPPGGGIALHQLNRIVRGLKGERLRPEAITQDDEYGEAPAEGPPEMEIVAEPEQLASQRDLLPSNDARLDQLIARSSQPRAGSDDEETREDAMLEKSYNQQMNEQGGDAFIKGDIGQRDTGVRNGRQIPNVVSHSVQEKKRKREAEDANSAAAAAKKARKEAKRREKELGRVQGEGDIHFKTPDAQSSQTVNGAGPVASQESHLAQKKRTKVKEQGKGKDKLGSHGLDADASHDSSKAEMTRKNKHKDKQ